MNRLFILSVVLLFSIPEFALSQENDYESDFENFLRYYNSGDLLKAEQYLLSSLESSDTLPVSYNIPLLNNLGAVNFLLGRYDRSLDYYNKAELLLVAEDLSQSLGDIYINKAIILGIQKSYANAFEYFERGIRIYDKLVIKDKSVILSLSLAYMNYGRILTENEEYQHALKLLHKSAALIENNKLSTLANVYLNIAQVCQNLNEFRDAELYYHKCIRILKENILISITGCQRPITAMPGFSGLKEEKLKHLKCSEWLFL